VPGAQKVRQGAATDQMTDTFKLVSEYQPAGDQPEAIRRLTEGLESGLAGQTLLGVTGSGKTYTAITQIYRLIKFGGARRVLFLVDRGNLAEQTEKEFQQYKSPYNNYKFTEEFIVQRLQGNTIDTTARVCICTIQRLFSMLKGRDLAEDLEEENVGAALAAIALVRMFNRG